MIADVLQVAGRSKRLRVHYSPFGSYHSMQLEQYIITCHYCIYTKHEPVLQIFRSSEPAGAVIEQQTTNKQTNNNSSAFGVRQCFQEHFDAPSARIRHPLPLKQSRLDIRAPSDAGFNVPRRLCRLRSLLHGSPQVRRVRGERIRERGERVDERAGRRARQRVRI